MVQTLVSVSNHFLKNTKGEILRSKTKNLCSHPKSKIICEQICALRVICGSTLASNSRIIELKWKINQ